MESAAMHPTSKASIPGTYYRPWLLLVLAGLGFVSSAAVASASGDPELQELRQQLQQMQSALQELSEENRALREHQQEIERRLTALAATAASPTPAAAAGTASPGSAPSNASALPSSAPVQNASALPATSAPPPGGSLVDALGTGL